MKKKGLLLVVLVCSLFLLVGCNKSESSSTKSSSKSDSSLVGTWEYESGGFVYTFNKDLTGVYDLGSSKMEFTYKTDGDKLSILYDGNTESFDTTYKIKGNKLTIKDSLDEDVVYIKK